MSQKSSLPQAASFVSQVLKRDIAVLLCSGQHLNCKLPSCDIIAKRDDIFRWVLRHELHAT